MKSLLVLDNLGIPQQGEFEFGSVIATGLVFKDDVAEADWHKLTEEICALFERTDMAHMQAAMMLGDALRFGEEKFGERYADAIDATRAYMLAKGIAMSKNWKWVAGKIPPERRHLLLTFGHHELVAKLPAGEQSEFLDLAEAEAMTVAELRKKVRERHPGKPKKAKKTKSADTTATALQKLIDFSNWLSEHPDGLTEKHKGPMTKIHLAFRRWQDKKRKR